MCHRTIPHVSLSQRHSNIFDWGIIAPGNGKEVVNGINSIEKRNIYQIMSNDRKRGVIDQVKYRKRSIKVKFTDIEYNVQDNADVTHKDVEMYCDTNKFPTLQFCGSHPNPHGSRELGKHYHLCFDPNLGYGICSVRRITFACVACTSIIDQPCISGIQSTKQARYQPVINCTYWTVLRPYNN